MKAKVTIAKKIIESDLFLSIPLSAQALYLHFIVSADDEGFVENPIAVQRMVGANANDTEILIGKGFIVKFKSGVVAIKQWQEHCEIRKDRVQKTKFVLEKAEMQKAQEPCVESGGYMRTEREKSNANGIFALAEERGII